MESDTTQQRQNHVETRSMGDGNGFQNNEGDPRSGVEAVKEQLVQSGEHHSHQHHHHHVEGDGTQNSQNVHNPQANAQQQGDVQNQSNVHQHQGNVHQHQTQGNVQTVPVNNNTYPSQQHMMGYNNNSVPGYHHCHCYGHCRGQVPNTVYQNENALDLGNLTLSGAKLHLPVVNVNPYPPSPVCQNHSTHSHVHQPLPQIPHQNNPVNIHRGMPAEAQMQGQVTQPVVKNVMPVREIMEDDQQSVRSARQDATEENDDRVDQYYEGTFPEFKNKREISCGFTGDSAKNLIYFQTDDFYIQNLGNQTKAARSRDNVSIVRPEAVSGAHSLGNMAQNTSVKKDIRVVPLKGAKSMVTCGGELVGGQQEPEVVPQQMQQQPEVETIGDCQSNDAIARQFEKVESKMKLLSKSRRLMTEQKLSRRNGLE